MELNDSQDFNVALYALAACFPPNQIPALEMSAEFFFEDMAEFSLETCIEIFRRARKGCRVFPTIAELLDIGDAIEEEQRRQRDIAIDREMCRQREKEQLLLQPPEKSTMTQERARAMAQALREIFSSRRKNGLQENEKL